MSSIKKEIEFLIIMCGIHAFIAIDQVSNNPTSINSKINKCFNQFKNEC